MNILIIGEYSGIANNLSHGFKKLGHSTVVITTGDGSKHIPYDSSDIFLKSYHDYNLCGINLRYSWVLRTYFANFIFNRRFVKNNKFDIIYIVNSEFVYKSLFSTVKRGINFKNLREGRLLKKNGKIILSCCGDDPALNKYSHTLDLDPLAISGPSKVFNKPAVVKMFDQIILISSIIHTTAFAYFHCINLYLNEKNIKKEIVPTFLPFSVPTAYNDNIIKNKVVIYHGILRSEMKGSAIICAAMKRLAAKYPNDVECIIKEKMPYEKYLSILDSCNILIDQAAGDGFGMNACNGLARGKVVMCSVTENTTNLMGASNCPIIGIRKDEDDIFCKLENLLFDRERIERISKESRFFAENYLADNKVAEKILQSIYPK